MVIKLIACLCLFTLFRIPSACGDNQQRLNDREQGEGFNGSGLGELPVIILVLCLLLTSVLVLLSCLNRCTLRLKYNVSDEENQKIADDYANDRSNFTTLKERVKYYMTAREYGIQTESSGREGLSSPTHLTIPVPEEMIKTVSPDKFKRVSIIAVPTSGNEDMNTSGMIRPKRFKRRRIRYHYNTGVRHNMRLRHRTTPHEDDVDTGAVRRKHVRNANGPQPSLIRPRGTQHRPFRYRHVPHIAHLKTTVPRAPAVGRRRRRRRRR